MKKITLITLMAIILMAGCKNSVTKDPKLTAIQDSLKKIRQKEDSLMAIAAAIAKEKQDNISAVAKVKQDSSLYADAKYEKTVFDKTPAGKVQKKHPEWSRVDCQKIADKEAWIGMSIDMAIYMYGRNFTRNVSNYGHGNEYQYCWLYRQTSCFYCKEDGIVYSFN